MHAAAGEEATDQATNQQTSSPAGMADSSSSSSDNEDDLGDIMEVGIFTVPFSSLQAALIKLNW